VIISFFQCVTNYKIDANISDKMVLKLYFTDEQKGELKPEM